MIRSRLLAAGASALGLMLAAPPAGARMLEIPLCAQSEGVTSPSGASPSEGTERTGAGPGTDPGDLRVARPFAQIGRLFHGMADIVWGAPVLTPSDFPRALLAELPGVVPKGMSGYELLWNAYDAGLLAREFPSSRPLAMWAASPRILIMHDIDVRVPGDLKGRRIRVVGPAGAAVLEAFGAIPVYMPADEISASLRTGLIDGLVGSPSLVGAYNLDEVARSYTLNAPLGRTSFFVAVENDSHGGPSIDQTQEIGRIAGRSLSQSVAESRTAAAAEIIEDLEIGGENRVYVLTADERAAFLTQSQPVTEALVTEGGNAGVLAVMQGR